MKLNYLIRISIYSLFIISINSFYNSCSGVKFSDAHFSNTTNPNGNNNGLGTNNNPCTAPDCPSTNPPQCSGKECEPCYNDQCQEPKVPVPYTTEYTVPQTSNKVDILMVVDDSGSMEEEHRKLSQKLENLITILNSEQIDWQICYTLTHVDERGTNAGKILDWYLQKEGTKGTSKKDFAAIGSTVLTSSTPNVSNVFSDTLKTVGVFDYGEGDGNEEPIIATRLAIGISSNESCFRPDAALTTITVTDEDERSCGGRCQKLPDELIPYGNRPISDYTVQYRKLTDDDNPQKLFDLITDKWPNKIFTAHSLSILRGDKTCYDIQDSKHPAFYGYVIQSLSDLTDGLKGDICASDYASQLTQIGEKTIKSLKSLTLKCSPSSIESVTVSPLPASGNSVPYTISGNKIYFDPPLAEGTQVTIHYTCLE